MLQQVRAGLARQRSVVLVETERPIIVTFGQQCLFRRPYPVGSFSGGSIVASLNRNQLAGSKRSLRELGRKLLGVSKTDRLVAWVDYLGELTCDPAWMELQLGIGRDEGAEVIKSAAKESDVIYMAGDPPKLVSAEALRTSRQYIVKLLTAQAVETDNAWAVEDSVAQRARTTGSRPLIDLAIEQLVDEKILVQMGKMVAIASDKTRLSKKQRALIDTISSLYQGSRTPPTLKELAGNTETTIESAGSLVRFLGQQGSLLDLGNGFWISADVFRDLCGELRDLFDESPQQVVAAIRDRWQLTRKHVIPLLEYCDRVGVTARSGDVRIAGPRIGEFLPEQVVEQD